MMFCIDDHTEVKADENGVESTAVEAIHSKIFGAVHETNLLKDLSIDRIAEKRQDLDYTMALLLDNEASIEKAIDKKVLSQTVDDGWAKLSREIDHTATGWLVKLREIVILARDRCR